MKYFLLWDKSTNNMIIDTHVRKGWKTEKIVVAESWLEAKKEFGFDLSPLQQRILSEKNNSAEVGGRVVGHQQIAGIEFWLADSELQDRREAGETAGINLW